MAADIVAVVCLRCNAVVSVCTCEAIAPVVERHLVQACAMREAMDPALFVLLQRRIHLYEAHAALWRGQQGRA